MDCNEPIGKLGEFNNIKTSNPSTWKVFPFFRSSLISLKMSIIYLFSDFSELILQNLQSLITEICTK